MARDHFLHGGSALPAVAFSYGYPAEPYRDRESCRPRMPSTPTTKSQVQAYRFVLRRMQSALVRKDAVMLHDPMRTHSRATAVGIILAAIGVLGFVIVGLLAPKPAVPDSGIIIAEPSGTVYVVSGNPKTLTPTFNLASARLLMLAQQNQGQDNGEDDRRTELGHVHRRGLQQSPCRRLRRAPVR